MKGIPLVVAVSAVMLVACTGVAGGPSPIEVKLESKSGSTATGVVRLSESSGGLRLRATVQGLVPNAESGFHIHEKGDCSAADASSAGGHFNPTGAPHGRYDSGAHHAGDLPSLKADAHGAAKVDVTLAGVTLRPGDNSVLNRALVVHAKPDDFTTQPSGNSGPRVACGVIR